MEKLSNTEAELKKNVTYKEKRVIDCVIISNRSEAVKILF